MIRILQITIVSLFLFAPRALAETTIAGVFIVTNGLGYDSPGYGIQIGHNDRYGNWGWDVEGMAVNHGKIGSNKGFRLQTIGMGRRFFGNYFIEAGIEWGGYKSEFPDRPAWVKYGRAPGVGIGALQDGVEWKIRYFAKDTTPNNTSVAAAAVDIPFGEWSIGATLERWKFDQNDDRLSGMQVALTYGRKF